MRLSLNMDCKEKLKDFHKLCMVNNILKILLMRRSIFSLLLIICLSITGISAQDIVSSNDNSCPFCKNGVHTESAPYDFNLKSEWSFLTVGAISLATGIVAN